MPSPFFCADPSFLLSSLSSRLPRGLPVDTSFFQAFTLLPSAPSLSPHLPHRLTRNHGSLVESPHFGLRTGGNPTADSQRDTRRGDPGETKRSDDRPAYLLADFSPVCLLTLSAGMPSVTRAPFPGLDLLFGR